MKLENHNFAREANKIKSQRVRSFCARIRLSAFEMWPTSALRVAAALKIDLRVRLAQVCLRES
jgi:hypothetical protein